MKKPIYRVLVDFEYRNNKRSNYIRTHIKNKLFRQIGKKEGEVDIKITNIEIEGRYGETNG